MAVKGYLAVSSAGLSAVAVRRPLLMFRVEHMATLNTTLNKNSDLVEVTLIKTMT
jgi:hypothetical protein